MRQPRSRKKLILITKDSSTSCIKARPQQIETASSTKPASATAARRHNSYLWVVIGCDGIAHGWRLGAGRRPVLRPLVAAVGAGEADDKAGDHVAQHVPHLTLGPADVAVRLGLVLLVGFHRVAVDETHGCCIHGDVYRPCKPHAAQGWSTWSPLHQLPTELCILICQTCKPKGHDVVHAADGGLCKGADAVVVGSAAHGTKNCRDSDPGNTPLLTFQARPCFV